MIPIGRGEVEARRLFDQRAGQPLELEDGRPPGLRSAALHVISYTVMAGIVWAAIAEVREVATASGELAPAGKIQAVQHLEGGIVGAVLAKAGSMVREGDPIVSLMPKQVASDLDLLRGRLAWLELEEIRLAAEQSGAKPDFSRFAAAHPDLVAPQQAAHAANSAERIAALEALDRRIAALRAQLDAQARQIATLNVELGTHQEIVDMQSVLADKGGTSRRAVLDVKVALQRATTSLAAATVQRAEVEADLSQALGERESTIAKARKDIADQRAKNMQQRAELAHQLEKISDRVDRLLVRAPVDGLVKDVTPKGPGSVIQPGQLVAEIVPKGQRLIAEVRIQPRDIGHVKAGDSAELEVTTYDVNLQGKIHGTVTDISASSFKSETGEPYFRGEISFDIAAQEEGIRRVTLMPGMIVEAHIITGSKSIMRYLLKPIYRSLDRGFSER